MLKRLSNSLTPYALIVIAGLSIGFIQTSPSLSQEKTETVEEIFQLSLAVLTGAEADRIKAVDRLVARGKKDIIPTFVLLMRISGDYKPVIEALRQLTGAELKTWREAMLWQEAHPEIIPHDSYRALKLRWISSVDKRFLQFFHEDTSSREKMKIRLEEVTWGGVRVDGIPSLDNPKLIDAKNAKYMNDTDLVFGVSINGDVRAYPLRIMGWHEMFNETIGGVPVALAYCTLCGSGILFETKVAGRKKPLVFGSSGLLYRSNKLMFDRETNSLWNQFTGEPVAGPLVDENIKLKIRPVTITSWAKWKVENPTTTVLNLDTGHIRDYDSGVVYKDYFSSPDLLFPTIVRDETRVKRKEYVFGIRDFGVAKAWPISAFSSKRVINDKIGSKHIVLIGDESTRTVRAYESKGLKFLADENALSVDGELWNITEEGLVNSSGEILPRVSGHVAYWFAWDGYLGVKSELYQG